jgi:hypothetical protein
MNRLGSGRLNFFSQQGTKALGHEGGQMNAEHTDLTVFARDYPETRLVLEVKSALSSPPQEDPVVKQVARSMWGANCHYGIIMTPTTTFILRDDFTAAGPESIRVTDELPTAKLLSRLGRPAGEASSEPQLQRLARAWLERLAASYEEALPEDQEVVRALFPDIVGAVAEGRVVAEVVAR